MSKINKNNNIEPITIFIILICCFNIYFSRFGVIILCDFFYTVLENLCTLYHCAVIATMACLYSCYYICNKCLCTYMYTCIYFRLKKGKTTITFLVYILYYISCYNQPKRCTFICMKIEIYS